MRKAFAERQYKIVTIAGIGPGGSSGILYELRVEALPAGFFAWLRAAYPPPGAFANGKPAVPDEGALADYNDRFNLIVLAKALEADGCLETPWPAKDAGRPAWHAFGGAIREEFQVACYSEGDVQQLALAALDLVRARDITGAEAARGN